jgi:DNA-3-methyladenine glycosylase I
MVSDNLTRCPWCLSDPLLLAYHDKEWGQPLHDEQQHFEFLTLEAMQAGLSWLIVLKKRENFREALDNFAVPKIASYDESDIEKILAFPGIIRNRRKIEATVHNARLFMNIQEEFGSFDHYIWGFVDFKPVVHACQTLNEIPVTSELSDRVSKDLKKRGFKFLGSTTIYAHLQAIGVINDHLVSCFRYQEQTQ